jgi:hypothetical protein
MLPLGGKESKGQGNNEKVCSQAAQIGLTSPRSRRSVSDHAGGTPDWCRRSYPAHANSSDRLLRRDPERRVLSRDEKGALASMGVAAVPQSRRELERLEDHLDQGGGLPLSLGKPQRNRNELGETTVNKTRQKHLSQREKSTT